MSIINQTILIISPEFWGVSYLSKHHYAEELSKNNKVYFLNPPSASFKGIEIKQCGESNLYIVNYNASFKGINRLPSIIRNKISNIDVKRILKAIDQSIDIVWSFDPFRFQNLKLFNAGFRIFHPVDVFHSNLEYECASSAEAIFSVAEAILKKFENISVPSYFINHGLSEVFIKSTEQAEYKSTENIKVGYVGNLLSNFLDYKTLTAIIKENQNIEFIFVGPYTPSNLSSKAQLSPYIEEIKAFKNVRLLGPQPPEKIFNLIKNMDVLLSCYDADKYPEGVSNSHKLLEYLSTGLIVVSNYVHSYRNNRELLLMSDSNKELRELFIKAIENIGYYNSKALAFARISFALDNSYKNQIQRIGKIINKIKEKQNDYAISSR